MAKIEIPNKVPDLCKHCAYYKHDTNTCEEDYCTRLNVMNGDITSKDKHLKTVNLKDIPIGEIRGYISEMLFDAGVCVVEMHEDWFFDECTHGKHYTVMYEGDIDIIFSECNDKDYPIIVSYQTIYSEQKIAIDYITKELFNKEINV